MIDPNDIFHVENVELVPDGFDLVESVQASYATKGQPIDNLGAIVPKVIEGSTAGAKGYKSTLPLDPGEYNIVIQSEREKSTDFIAVDINDWIDEPAWNYDPVYKGFRLIPGTDWLQFAQRYVARLGPAQPGQPAQSDNLRVWKAIANGQKITYVDPEGNHDEFYYARAEDIVHLDLSFDQNGRPILVWEEAGKIHLRWYNPIAGGMVVVELGFGVTPFVSMDGWDSTLEQTENFIVYSRDGKLCYRRQLDRFETEYVIVEGNVGSVVALGVTAFESLVISYFDHYQGVIDYIATRPKGKLYRDRMANAVGTVNTLSILVRKAVAEVNTRDQVSPAVSSMNDLVFTLPGVTVHEIVQQDRVHLGESKMSGLQIQLRGQLINHSLRDEFNSMAADVVVSVPQIMPSYDAAIVNKDNGFSKSILDSRDLTWEFELEKEPFSNPTATAMWVKSVNVTPGSFTLLCEFNGVALGFDENSALSTMDVLTGDIVAGHAFPSGVVVDQSGTSGVAVDEETYLIGPDSKIWLYEASGLIDVAEIVETGFDTAERVRAVGHHEGKLVILADASQDVLVYDLTTDAFNVETDALALPFDAVMMRVTSTPKGILIAGDVESWYYVPGETIRSLGAKPAITPGALGYHGDQAILTTGIREPVDSTRPNDSIHFLHSCSSRWLDRIYPCDDLDGTFGNGIQVGQYLVLDRGDFFIRLDMELAGDPAYYQTVVAFIDEVPTGTPVVDAKSQDKTWGLGASGSSWVDKDGFPSLKTEANVSSGSVGALTPSNVDYRTETNTISSFTYEGLFYIDSVSTLEDYQTLAYLGHPTNSNINFFALHVRNGKPGGNVGLADRPNGTVQAYSIRGVDDVPLDEWFHLALSLEGTELYLHLNGKVVAQHTFAGPSWFRVWSNQQFYVGPSRMPNGTTVNVGPHGPTLDCHFAAVRFTSHIGRYTEDGTMLHKLHNVY